MFGRINHMMDFGLCDLFISDDCKINADCYSKLGHSY